MPQHSSWLAVQTLINQHLTDLAILAEFFLTLFLIYSYQIIVEAAAS